MKSSEKFCDNPNCKVNTYESLYNDKIDEIYNQAISCDNCYSVVSSFEEDSFSTLESFRDEMFLTKSSQFQESLDILTAEKMEAKQNTSLPLYLKNYMDISFRTEKKEVQDSMVIKIAKGGIKLLNAIFPEKELEMVPAYLPSVRSKEKELEEALNIKEQLKEDEIIYQIIKENEEEAYLCINILGENKNGFHQVNLKKNNRFIFSSQINDRGIVSFSGLKEGRYNIEFVGKKSSKSIDLTILIDQV
ncbi:MAG: hypothetical protein KDK36_00120 [Leptospiraceae bacterium]|nr:hypothetical protein [Leptospiraceae bacterium]